MSDEARDAHLGWLDDCAKEQDECEHKWRTVRSRHPSLVIAYCGVEDCGAQLEFNEANAMLCEHALLEEENTKLKHQIKTLEIIVEDKTDLNETCYAQGCEIDVLKRKNIESFLIIQPCVQQLQDSMRKGDLVLNDYLASMVAQIAEGVALLTAEQQEDETE